MTGAGTVSSSAFETLKPKLTSSSTDLIVSNPATRPHTSCLRPVQIGAATKRTLACPFHGPSSVVPASWPNTSCRRPNSRPYKTDFGLCISRDLPSAPIAQMQYFKADSIADMSEAERVHVLSTIRRMDPPDACDALINIRPYLEKAGVVYMQLRNNWEELERQPTVPVNEFLDYLDAKIGEARDIGIRRAAYKKCDGETILWCYYYPTGHAKLIEAAKFVIANTSPRVAPDWSSSPRSSSFGCAELERFLYATRCTKSISVFSEFESNAVYKPWGASAQLEISAYSEIVGRERDLVQENQAGEIADSATKAARSKKRVPQRQLVGPDTGCKRGLRALGLPKDDPTLQPLGRKEQWGKGSKALKSTRSKDREPWFWSAQRPSGLDDKGVVAWEKEMDRVQWFRERALMKRAKEEIEILEEEFKRAKRWFTQTSEIWTKMAGMEKRGDYHDDQGWRAYAYRQAAIYEDLAHQSEAEWVKLPQLIAQDAIAEANKAKEDEEERERDSREEPDYKLIMKWDMYRRTIWWWSNEKINPLRIKTLQRW
ncbi:hypothetical protein B0H14DRAFT_2626823 [Mycena olivaceomarginata]|nr:hypothetical protein B0H14DRAFT_2626823 [Mycena olivaceomarginata]